jgi:glycine oxidase
MMVHSSSGKADSPVATPGQSADLPANVDLLIIGGGVMGLWAAVKAERLGLSALLIEAQQPGAGASGGVLGALMAHLPDRWSDKKQVQFDCLVSLEDEVARLESETGLSCGYRRSGRLIPLPKPHLRSIAEGHAVDAEAHWRAGGRRFDWSVLDHSPCPHWLSSDAGPSGIALDTLAARIAPRSLVAALSAAIDGSRSVQRRSGLSVGRLAGDHALLANGGRVGFGHCIVAAGHQSFALLEDLDSTPGKRLQPLGSAVKGQAAILKADVDPDLPVIFLNGLYVVAHEAGHVAIGSTSENRFDVPLSTDRLLDDLIARARLLSPALESAPIIERWAGLRPKAIDRDPMVGPHPDSARISALTGGFKVSFGIAHRLADAVLAGIAGGVVNLPASFLLEHHLRVASQPV